MSLKTIVKKKKNYFLQNINLGMEQNYCSYNKTHTLGIKLLLACVNNELLNNNNIIK
jgi:hypothetical protein